MSKSSPYPTQYSKTLVFFINGKKVVDVDVDPEVTLLHYLRRKLCLRGTKLVCGEGGCGACTVMVSKLNRETHQIRHFTVNACLAPVCSMHGLAVTTVEGIGSTAKGLHPVQERLAKSHGSQCGFCSPGMVMTMYTLLRNNPLPSALQLEQAFDGNLCRCTGYRPILEGYKTFTKEFCSMGEKCCRNNSAHPSNSQQEVISSDLFDSTEFAPFVPSQEPIFPPELQLTLSLDSESLRFISDRVTWFRPVTLHHLLSLKAEYPYACLLEIGIDAKLCNVTYPVVIATSNVPNLNVIEAGEMGMSFGSSVTLSLLWESLNNAINTLPEHQTRTFHAFTDMLQWFAGHQIRNVATLVGNIMTASPISDLNPLLLAVRATLLVQSKAGGKRTVKMDDKFFSAYKKTTVQPEEVVITVTIPYSQQDEYIYGYKQAHRREADIAIVNAGMYVKFKPGTDVVADLVLSYGGMAPTTALAQKAMKQSIDMGWNEDLLKTLCNILPDDLPLSPGAPGGMADYRRTLTLSFFFKFYLTVKDQLLRKVDGSIDSTCHSVVIKESPSPSESCQVYEEVAPGQLSEDPVGRPVKVVSADKQVTGEAVFVDDMPEFENELHASLVLSTKAHAKLLSVDPSRALTMPGVVDYVSHSDVTGSNTYGILCMDEEIFATNMVYCEGQVIGMILADSLIRAQRAVKAMVIDYEELEPIITIQEAIKKSSYYDSPRSLVFGDIEVGFAESDHILEGSYVSGGQEHFYFEPQSCIALPKNEDGEMEIFSCTQHPSDMQDAVSSALGVSKNRIVVRVKRLGGGFGGKETRSRICVQPAAVAANKHHRAVRLVLDREEDMISTGTRHPFYSTYKVCGGFGGKETRSRICVQPAAVAANKHHRAVRLVLDREEDMISTGTRHPFYSTYKVGFTTEGKLKAADFHIYCNAGSSTDLSPAVVAMAMMMTDTAYAFPNIRITGQMCKTNTPSNTAFRGLGAPQGMLLCENMMDHIATTLSINPIQVRKLNLYHDGDLTPTKQVLVHCTIDQCWEQCLQKSDYHRRSEDVQKYNSENRWTKRGIYMNPTKFGIGFPTRPYNQAGALVHVYTDGSVFVSPAGVEMGQGLHTKIIQVVSRVLGIPVSMIYISETSTHAVPNPSPTVASTGSDLNCMAVIRACETIKERLTPLIKANPNGRWEDWVKQAYLEQVSLSATGHYSLPHIRYDMRKNEGTPFNYYCYGAACSEVQIDCLTGDHQVLRTDIVMDVGTSLNPAIDIGQIEGAFMQGYGLMCLEQQKYSPSGRLLSRGLGTYKIPSLHNIPKQFNVSLLKGNPNPKAVYSSKAIGEPPLFLASSVLFAIKDAIKSARLDSGLQGNFTLHSPATPERIRMACVDQFTEKFPPADPDSYKPWFVTL